MIVTDNIMVKQGYVDKLRGILKDEDLESAVFDKANFEPTTTLIDEGVKLFKDEAVIF